MQKHDNNNKRKVPTSIEIVDVPPPTDNESSKAEDASVSGGTTKLSKDELHDLFQDRNLAFVKRRSPTCNSSMDRVGRRFDLDKYF